MSFQQNTFKKNQRLLGAFNRLPKFPHDFFILKTQSQQNYGNQGKIQIQLISVYNQSIFMF